MVKEAGVWTATEEGLEWTWFTDPEQFMDEAGSSTGLGCRCSRQKNLMMLKKKSCLDASLTLEKAEEAAWRRFSFLALDTDPYDLQHLVAGLLRGMGHDVL